jgi:hypothetical protein
MHIKYDPVDIANPSIISIQVVLSDTFDKYRIFA